MAERAQRGPPWLWVTAWSLQGAGVLLVDKIGIDHEFARLGAIGVIAALPLAGLYLLLRRLPVQST